MTTPNYDQFVCNLCGNHTKVIHPFHREGGNCQYCHANIRFRSLIYALSYHLHDKSISLSEFPINKNIKAIGLSDAPHYADKLATLFNYTNFFYHTEPFLDICNIESMDTGSYDLLITSDVYEHVPPPRHAAFFNSSRLLKKGGVLLLTVPYTYLAKTVEHFPRLHQFGFVKDTEGTLLINRCKDQTMEVYDGLTWHGGEGSTLELRVFAEADLLNILVDAGFKDIKIWNEDIPEHGILQAQQGGSFVISAIKASDPIQIPATEHDPYCNNCYSEESYSEHHDLIHPPIRIADSRSEHALVQWQNELLGDNNNRILTTYSNFKAKLHRIFCYIKKS